VKLAKLALACVLLAVTTVAAAAEPMPTRFTAYEVHLDPGSAKLAAWQVEVVLADASASIVGVEGGTTPAFREPAYHDPEALQAGRIVIATFTTGQDVSAGSQHVATLHVAETPGAESPTIRVMAAADPAGRTLRAEARIEPSRDTP